MDRRNFIRSVAASLTTFVLPAPRKFIDLTPFCTSPRGDLIKTKYDTKLPYELNDFVFATDCKVCVRVRPQSGDKASHEGLIPPFQNLFWDHDERRGWMPMPKLSPMVARDSTCNACEGFGVSRGHRVECKPCDGFGCEWCDFNGYVPEPGAMWCHACHGSGEITRPSIVQMPDGTFVDADMYAKVQALGSEYVHTYSPNLASMLIQFKFDGGCGLMLPVSSDYAKRRIVKGGAS